MNRLGFEWRTFTADGRSYDYLDYLVDDTPLPTWLGYVTGEPERWSVGSQVTPFWRGVNRVRARTLYRMFRAQSPGDVTIDRIPIYVCSHCGDYGCGVSSVVLKVDDAVVRWRDFAEPNETRLIPHVPEIVFERREYMLALAVTKAI